MPRPKRGIFAHFRDCRQHFCSKCETCSSMPIKSCFSSLRRYSRVRDRTVLGEAEASAYSPTWEPDSEVASALWLPESWPSPEPSAEEPSCPVPSEVPSVTAWPVASD